ncbi:MAG TPA: winged helix-turn-helix transcriptional regulator [Nitrososphaera sp.]|nr:winged helix-turn-helix transcriptional regulator [Nitrososphaera sp.]
MSEAEIWRMLGKRWMLPILKSMGQKEAVRFSEIKKALVGISGTVLSERFLELEREGLVAKIQNSSKIEYSLTAGAKELEAMLAELDRWWSARRLPLIANYQ